MNEARLTDTSAEPVVGSVGKGGNAPKKKGEPDPAPGGVGE